MSRHITNQLLKWINVKRSFYNTKSVITINCVQPARKKTQFDALIAFSVAIYDSFADEWNTIVDRQRKKWLDIKIQICFYKAYKKQLEIDDSKQKVNRNDQMNQHFRENFQFISFPFQFVVIQNTIMIC